MTDALQIFDLGAQRERLDGRLEAAAARVLRHGRFINGPEVQQFEAALAEHAGVAHAVGCGNGTDALVLALKALGIGPGDAVLVPDFTFVATAEAVVLVGATPVFVDVDPVTCLLDPEQIPQGIAVARDAGLVPRAIMPVDLFGQPADYPRLREAAGDLIVVSDCAQGYGATLKGRSIAQWADITCTSFFPTKPLGAAGDGGAVLTDDPEVEATLRSLRAHGGGSNKYDNVRIGTNSRLDTIQAALLLEKLPILEDEIAVRARNAAELTRLLGNRVRTPVGVPGADSAWALYTVQTDRRDDLQAGLKAMGIGSGVYYAVPQSRQPAYRDYPRAGGCANARRLSQRVLSLPCHAYLTHADLQRIADAVQEIVGDQAAAE